MGEPDTEEPATMLALHHEKFGGPAVDRVGQIARPGSPGTRQLLVRVHASSLNPADFKARSGAQKALLSHAWPQVYGFDFSGDVVSVGAEVGGAFAAGDAVFGMRKGVRRGCCAEYVLVDADICAKKPAAVSHNDAASVPLVAITAVMMFRACGLQELPTGGEAAAAADRPGPRVLITGGAGGVGTCAIQLAKQLYGASFVATTASAGAKTELVRGLGADCVVNYREEKFEEVLLRPGAEGEPAPLFDAILDCTGEVTKCPPLLAQGGGICSILKAPTVDALREWLRDSETERVQRITFGVKGFLQSSMGGGITNCVTGARSLLRQCEAKGGRYAHVIGTGNGEIMQTIAKLMETGRLRAVLDSTFPLSQGVEAVARSESGRAGGKVVVEVIPEA